MMTLNRRDFLGLAAGTAAGTLLSGCNLNSQKFSFTHKFDQHALAPTPPLGWNSYNCYSIFANERLLRENLEVFAKRLKPFGYKYFVIDAGWFHEFDNPPTEEFPANWPAKHVRLDEYGRPLVSRHFFPNGLKPLIDRAHELDIKFGLWMIRGINKKAVEQNLPIKGTKYHAADIADKKNVCPWWPDNYGVDMTKPGAQEYYNSLLELLASWKIDFVKYDDIVPHPAEIEAVANAIENCGRDIVLSLSPDGDLKMEDVKSYQRANALRITPDVWDDRSHLEMGFYRWEQMQNLGGDGFWLDLDMIPFGRIMVANKKPAGTPPEKAKDYERTDLFTPAQRETFIAQRALCASPLIMGAELITCDDTSFLLVTDRDMLACNQNGVTGKLAFRQNQLDVWKTPNKKHQNAGWLGVFNRGQAPTDFTLAKVSMGLDPAVRYELFDIWKKQNISDADKFALSIPADGVVFLRYKQI